MISFKKQAQNFDKFKILQICKKSVIKQFASPWMQIAATGPSSGNLSNFQVDKFTFQIPWQLNQDRVTHRDELFR